MKNIKPINGMEINESVRLEPGTVVLPDGLHITADGITVDGNGATLIGLQHQGVGVVLSGRQDVTIKNLQISGYFHGIEARDCQNLTIKHCRITDTAEVAANTVFLDIWREVNNPYGGAIFLAGVRDSRILNNDMQHQMNGLLSYYCRDLTVQGNNASYNSGFGFHLYETTHSTFHQNWADYCCRYEPRKSGKGHLGADSAGFLIVHNASHNTFTENMARMSGDGFFLAGLTPDGESVSCNHNRFEGNDASYSPNNAFEATFSEGNHFVNNQASYSNYGFWLGFSRANQLTKNHIIGNHRAGIAAENGSQFDVINNTLQDNQIGVLIWSKPIPQFLKAFPQNETSKFWRINRNTIHRNGTGIRIAANQDHGTRPYPLSDVLQGNSRYRPHDHEVAGNVISENRLGIQTLEADRTIIKDNTFRRNITGDIKS
jgi:parallel beta-helix repeat protein